MRVLVTGIAGFAGSHLADYLLADGAYQVAGVVRTASDQTQLAPHRDHLALFTADLTDEAAVRAVLSAWAPERIYHLAAQASVGASWADPAETLRVNTMAQLNLLRAVADLAPQARVLVVGSADEYGRVTSAELPLTENSALRPASPYALSKVNQDLMGAMYRQSHGLAIVRVRPFNHIGPRQRTGFVVPDFCRQIARIEASQQEPAIRVGNLTARRDFLDVRDVVRAYVLALELGELGAVYNICRGRSVAIQELLDRLLGLARVPVAVEMDTSRLRPSDMPDLVGSAALLTQQTGWHPQIELEQSLRDTLDYWRGIVAAAEPSHCA